jgi:LPS-assembly protein
VSQLYLTGRGDRSYFDMRTIKYYGYSESDVQSTLPVILPVIDYAYTFEQPVFNGELSYVVNFTSLSRQTASYDAISLNAVVNSWCSNNADTAQKIAPNCLLRGFPGVYSRVSAETSWRSQYIDPLGEVFTPFASVRADAAAVSVQAQPGVANYLTPGDTDVSRLMPTVGLEYRYPFVAIEPWGTQTVQPIGQLIVRPSETAIGKLPNEDSQSLVFDDTNLFKVDKFAGWDRVEGGGRVNAGFQYTAQVNRAGSFNVLFGQSYQIYGINSYAATDLTNTGLESGLDKTYSDYVARVMYQPNQVYSFIARGRFSSGGFDPGLGQDVKAFTPQRLEFEARANFDRWTLQAMYGEYAPQPEIGFLTKRDELLAGASVKVTQNWVILGSVRYDLAVDRFDQTRFGIGYTDDCLLVSFNYLTSFTYTNTTPTPNNYVYVQFSLRTLGPDYLAPLASGY